MDALGLRPVVFGDRIEIRSGMFGSLEELQIFTDPHSLRALLTTYFAGSETRLSHLTFIPESNPFLEKKIERLDNATFSIISKSLQILCLDYPDLDDPGVLTAEEIPSLGLCGQLNNLSLKHPLYASISHTELNEIIPSWSNIRSLSITRQSDPFVGFDTAEQLRSYTGPGIDMSCLELLSAKLHRLEELTLCVLACDTSTLQSDESIHSFRRLKVLRFAASSFLNCDRPGFDGCRAAKYIGAVVTPTTEVWGERLDMTEVPFDDDWRREYAAGFDPFFQEFIKQIENLVEIRKSQTRLASPASVTQLSLVTSFGSRAGAP
jgi:hypothetical protein